MTEKELDAEVAAGRAFLVGSGVVVPRTFVPAPMRPLVLDETWRVFDEPTPLAMGYVVRAQVEEPSGLAGAWLPATSPEQARLASAAPDMARALLACEWAGRVVDGVHCACPLCDNVAPDHLPDCALDAALRKAGIR